MILFILCAIAGGGDHEPRALWRDRSPDRFERKGHSLLGCGHRLDVGGRLRCLKPAVLGGGGGHDGTVNSARAGYAESYLLITILAAVLGGVDPNGGFGKVLGLFLSLVLLQIISTGFNLLGVSPHLTEAIWGATMILAIALALVRDRWVARLWLGKT